ncbi:CoA transferase [Lipingzhangella sp. LS1_29]|uniref:CoA transferase n=1 Tax=Lipingzhangella rawalii TaxID=2055835 RepID=A0ABU2H5E9_9ACTN|nr:CoA transferase [Lipingzhangella rawalii]MDS1270536.1 CoA transferase [Lipingzhangella rawalii]
MSTPPENSHPLDGILIADFSRILAGPYATMLLADLGAEVIKVESPTGDDTRTWIPPERDGVATYYLGINRNKRSVSLDLSTEDDRALAQELAARSDILIENFKPGGLGRFGLDYESLRPTNPGLIYASISGFGTAEGATLPGYDLLVQAASGLMSLTGSPEGPPYRAGISVFDVMTGMHTAIGVLSALHQRQATGTGQHLEMNLMSSALSGLVNHTAAHVAGGVVPQRMGNAHPSLFPYEPLPTADRELIVIAGNDGQFRRLCTALGLENLPDDERFRTTEDRTHNRDQLRPLLVERLCQRPADEWFETLSAAGVPCGPINSVDQGVQLARDLGLDPVVTIPRDTAELPSIRNPITFSDASPRYDLPPPELDEHGADIRAWLRSPRHAPTTHTKERP